MKKMTAVLAMAALLAPLSSAHSQSRLQSFSFNAPSISGLSGEVSLTGGGVVNPGGGFVHTGGSFSVVNDITAGPLAGLRQGDGVRWDSDEVVPSVGFKCSGPEVKRTVQTDDHTIILQADFYRAGDGNTAHFTAKMIISSQDLDDLEPGNQNIWIEGVGCGEALVNFR